MNLRSSGLVVASTLVLATLVGCGSDSDDDTERADRSETVEPATNPATDAALAWLDEQQLDLGAQADLHLALETLGDDTRQEQIVDNFTAGADAYVNTSYSYEGSDYSGVSSGAVAKTLYVATEADLDPTAFGADDGEQLDLLDLLSERMTAEGPSQGRLADLARKDGKPDPESNYANTFGQAYAVRGLAESDGDLADELYEPIRDFLLAQQCEAGFFRLYFNPDAEADEQSCDAADPAEEAPAGDTTALVLLLLDDVAADDPVVADALDRAEEWLAEQQADDGTFPSEPAGAEPNTNSVGMAGWALGVRGDSEAALAASAWVRQHQLVGFACDAEAAKQEGAIALTDRARADAVEQGVDQQALMEWQAATVQATAVLAWEPETSKELQVNSETVDDGVQVEVTGAVPGEPVCATAGDTTALGFADDTGAATIDVAATSTSITVDTLAKSQELEAQ